MEFIVQKIGMSRTIDTPSHAVTLCKIIECKVCEVKNNVGFVAFSKSKNINKAIQGNQKKYNLSKEFNNFATLKVANTESGDLVLDNLQSMNTVKVSFKTKGRGFSGVIKRWNFKGGPAAHGSRFHRRVGSIGNREWPGRVQKGKKMPGQFGNELVSTYSTIISFDKETKILVLKGSIPGFNGAFGRIEISQMKKAS